MSHFTVLVVTYEKPTDDVLTKALQPFHEFGCTGVDDQYVQDIDETEDLRAQYEKDTSSRLRSPDGSLHDPYANQFYRDPTPAEEAKHKPMIGTSSAGYTSRDWGDGRGYRAKFRFVPQGWEAVEIPTKSTKTFAEFVEYYSGRKPVLYGQSPDLDKTHKYGYALLDADGSVAKVINRDNPNHKWDWWTLGGRWQGMLFAKRAAFSKLEVGRGRPGLMDSTHTNSKDGGVDFCRVGDLDIERMKNAAVAERQTCWATVQSRARENGLEQSPAELDATRRAFAKERDAVWKAWRDSTDKGGKHWMDLLDERQKMLSKVFYDWDAITTDEDIPIQDWIDAAPPFSTFAVLKDGQWYARGGVGWWGVVHDDKDTWSQEFEKLLRSLRPDQFVAVVDCHT